jgi:hypothetical protein
MRHFRPQFHSQRTGDETGVSAHPAASAIAAFVRFVGCWMAFTVAIMAAANELPATVNKVCPTGNRPLRTAGMAAARNGPRVAIIEPDSGHEHDSDTRIDARPQSSHADTLDADRHVAAASVATSSTGTHASAHHAALPPSAAATADAATALTHAPPGTRAFSLSPASYFPPHYNRPPPVPSLAA